MHQLENRLIAGQLPGGVGKIVVGDQFAADHLGQGVGIQHGLHDMVVELGRAELALSVGLHGQRGVESPSSWSEPVLSSTTKLPEGSSGTDR